MKKTLIWIKFFSGPSSPGGYIFYVIPKETAEYGCYKMVFWVQILYILAAENDDSLQLSRQDRTPFPASITIQITAPLSSS